LYPFDEILLLALLAVLAGADSVAEIAGSAATNANCSGAFARSSTALRRTITSATSFAALDAVPQVARCTAARKFRAACRNASRSLGSAEFGEEVLDQATGRVDMAIELPGLLAIGL
jgi:hypothetical protein